MKYADRMRWPYLVGTASALLVGGAIGRGLFATAAGVLVSLGVVLAVWVVLPRAAHRAFVRGRANRARHLYRLFSWCVIGKRHRAAVFGALAACELAAGHHESARARLDGISGESLPPPKRAAWLNNRAYALARSGADAGRALSLIDEAIALHGEVPAFVHTRGVVLLALGRAVDATRDLSAAWDAQLSESAFESERCFDLARAFQASGRADLASDYYARAAKAAPKATWAQRAATASSQRDTIPKTFYSPGL